MMPRWLQNPRMQGDPPHELDRHGFAADGGCVWLHGPEIHTVGGFRARVWVVRRQSGPQSTFHRCRPWDRDTWDAGAHLTSNRADALATFREYVNARHV